MRLGEGIKIVDRNGLYHNHGKALDPTPQADADQSVSTRTQGILEDRVVLPTGEVVFPRLNEILAKGFQE